MTSKKSIRLEFTETEKERLKKRAKAKRMPLKNYLEAVCMKSLTN